VAPHTTGDVAEDEGELTDAEAQAIATLVERRRGRPAYALAQARTVHSMKDQREDASCWAPTPARLFPKSFETLQKNRSD
jgi:hypothetical protein